MGKSYLSSKMVASLQRHSLVKQRGPYTLRQVYEEVEAVVFVRDFISQGEYL